MASSQDWRLGLGAAMRFEMVQQIQRSIESTGVSKTEAQKGAFLEEKNAYNSSESRDKYDAACSILAATSDAEEVLKSSVNDSTAYGIDIGQYYDCHHISTGLVSEVFRSKAVALKIITETRDVEPHNPSREIKILQQISHERIIRLIETEKDTDGRLILVFPFMPFTFADILATNSLKLKDLVSHFKDLFSALEYLHNQGIIHRDIKPANLLLASSSGPMLLCDFGTAWHPRLSKSDEPAECKVLEVGTSCYRAPETLFGNRSYNTSLDMWAAGTMLAECLQVPTAPLFESRNTSEDGNQLGLILSIFKTIGTPTKETWPEATNFTTPPFEWYQEFPGHPWEELLPHAPVYMKDLVSTLVCYESQKRMTATMALEFLSNIPL